MPASPSPELGSGRIVELEPQRAYVHARILEHFAVAWVKRTSAPLLSCGTLASRAGCSGHLRPCSRPDSSPQVRVECRKPGHRRGATRRSPPLAECWLYSNFAAQRERPRRQRFAAAGPPLDVDQLVALDLTKDDPLGPTAAAGAAAERHGCDRSATPLELGSHVVAREDLVSTRPETRLVNSRCLAAGGRATGLVRDRRAFRTPSRSPPARAMWSADGLAVVRPPHGSRHRAAGPPDRSGTTHRAKERDRSPRPPRRAERHANHVMLLCSMASGGPSGPPAISRVRPRLALEMRRCSAAGFPSTFRPPVSPRPYSGRRGRSLILLAICRQFVPASEHP